LTISSRSLTWASALTGKELRKACLGESVSRIGEGSEGLLKPWDASYCWVGISVWQCLRVAQNSPPSVSHGSLSILDIVLILSQRLGLYIHMSTMTNGQIYGGIGVPHCYCRHRRRTMWTCGESPGMHGEFRGPTELPAELTKSPQCSNVFLIRESMIEPIHDFD